MTDRLVAASANRLAWSLLPSSIVKLKTELTAKLSSRLKQVQNILEGESGTHKKHFQKTRIRASFDCLLSAWFSLKRVGPSYILQPRFAWHVDISSGRPCSTIRPRNKDILNNAVRAKWLKTNVPLQRRAEKASEKDEEDECCGSFYAFIMITLFWITSIRLSFLIRWKQGCCYKLDI